MPSAKTLATRFRVFRYVQRYIRENGEWPSCGEVAESLRIKPSTAHSHMRRLDGATGISGSPHTLKTGQNHANEYLRRRYSFEKNQFLDPWRTPVDRLFAMNG